MSRKFEENEVFGTDPAIPELCQYR